MKKLLDREPTEAMEKAFKHAYNQCKTGWSAVMEGYYALFDAAPELTVDMEPVAEMRFLAFGWAIMPIERRCDADKTWTKYYSATQLATAVETERKKWEAEVTRLNKGWQQARIDLLSSELSQSKALESTLTAARDELLEALNSLRWVCEYNDEGVFKQITDIIANHEGDKQ